MTVKCLSSIVLHKKALIVVILGTLLWFKDYLEVKDPCIYCKTEYYINSLPTTFVSHRQFMEDTTLGHHGVCVTDHVVLENATNTEDVIHLILQTVEMIVSVNETLLKYVMFTTAQVWYFGFYLLFSTRCKVPKSAKHISICH